MLSTGANLPARDTFGAGMKGRSPSIHFKLRGAFGVGSFAIGVSVSKTVKKALVSAAARGV